MKLADALTVKSGSKGSAVRGAHRAFQDIESFRHSIGIRGRRCQGSSSQRKLQSTHLRASKKKAMEFAAQNAVLETRR